MIEPEMQTVLNCMLRLQRQAEGMERLLLVRDGMNFSQLWQTSFRGCNTGSIRLESAALPTGGSVQGCLYPVAKLTAGACLHLMPDHTKKKKVGHCTIVLSCGVLCM